MQPYSLSSSLVLRVLAASTAVRSAGVDAAEEMADRKNWQYELDHLVEYK